MSERFYYDFEDPLGHKILEDGEILSQLNTVGEFRKITDRLNTLYNEKEELDQNLTELADIKNSDKQYSQLNLLSWITCRILDLEAIEDTLLTFDEVIEILNKLNNENIELQKTIETICEDYEKAHGMDIRNSDWFTAW